jgi:hypothetical protein
MSHYLTEFSGDEVRAIALYNWNVEVSSAIWELLSYVEIALSNTIANHSDLMQLANFISPEFGRWLFSLSRVPKILDRRPY